MISSCVTLLSVISVGIAGHASGKPPCQAGSLGLGALVFHVLPIPNNIVLPLQLSDHQEDFILKRWSVHSEFFIAIVIVNISVGAVLP